MIRRNALHLLLLACALFLAERVFATDAAGAVSGTPDAVIDLATDAGTALVQGQWRYSDTKIIATSFYAAGADGQPSATPVQTYDYAPKAGGADFDDSSWPAIAPETLQQRRGFGRLGFSWYRIAITVPGRVGDFDPTGATITFETSLDDYAEIWVNGELARSIGQSGGSVIAGWNAPNRLVVGRNVMPGQKIQLAIFGINGPISNPPTNYIWMRFAKLSFYQDAPHGPVAVPVSEVNVEVERKDPAIDELIGRNTKVWKLADGFKFTEGPVWAPEGKYLLFSDPNANTIYKYVPGQTVGELSVFRTSSGYSGADIAEYRQPGSNGLALGPQGRLTINQHGNRRIVQLDAQGHEAVIVDRYEGKRLNSPNDLVYRSDGALFFTDPFFGLPKFGDDPHKELPFQGVFALINGKMFVIDKALQGPNGIAFSPDEKYLYIGNWDDHNKAVYRYRVNADGGVSSRELFFDMTSAKGEDAIDGIKVDERGNLYVSGPGGLWIISPEGKHLGTVVPPQHPHNMAWGDDGKSLYLCARSGLYRMRVNVKGSTVK